MSWRHVSPSHTRTRRRKRRLRRQRSDDDERTGLHTTTNKLGSTRRRTPSTKTRLSPNCSSTRRYPHKAQPSLSTRQLSKALFNQLLQFYPNPGVLLLHTRSFHERLPARPLSTAYRPLFPSGPPLGRGFFPLGQSGQRTRPPLNATDRG